MTAFVLVPGFFTGGHVWEATAARLTAAGAEAHPVTLSGLTEPYGPTGPGPDMQTHVAEVVQLIDSVGAADGQDVVLVGHDYGLHPVLGAADRRPGRIARIVCLDTAPLRDGATALASLPDVSLREELAARVRQPGGTRGGCLPPPATPEEWQRWGSTVGVPREALDRLTRLAAPQPLATLLEPLGLTGAADGVPVTGVLCTAGSAGIAMVQRAVDLGDPALRALAEAGVRLLELPTGHWPMLSCPEDLADVLLRAAAGEGHLLARRSSGPPPHLRPFVLDPPEARRERIGPVDLHLPESQEPRPAVVFVHGGPVPAGARPTPRDWPTLVGYARLVAEQGVVGATFDHRLHDVGAYGRAADDLASAVAAVRADPRVDADRIALWFFSGGGLLAADWLDKPAAWLRCLAATYPLLAPLPSWGVRDSRFRPADVVRHAGGLPVVLTRVERESPEIAATVTEFLAAAEEADASVEVIDVPDGLHGFDYGTPTDAARAAVRDAVRTVLAHLTAQGTFRRG